MTDVELALVQARDVRPLRAEVLRPGLPAVASEFDGDERALHVAARIGGRTVAVGTIVPEPYPAAARAGDWRIRGMATEPELRGTGIGAAVLDELIRRAASQGARRVWCHARVGARSLYERAGLRAEGEPYEIAGIGPHVLLSRELDARAAAP